MTRPEIEGISPFFIVSNVDQTIAFYRDKLGFETQYREPDREPFFAIVARDGAHLFVKSGEAAPQPNLTRDPAIKWDAYLYVPDPDALAAEFEGRGAPFRKPLMITTERLRGFEISDPNG